MSSVVMIFIHYIRSFEQFPRVIYFFRRFTGLTPRFFNIQAALPSNFFDKTVNDQLKKLTEVLGRRVTIIIYGSRDIPDTDLGISQLLQSTVNKETGNDLKISKVLQSTADEGASELDGITIVVLTAEFENIDLNAEKTLESIADQFSSSSAKDKLWSFELLIIHCRVSEKCLSSLTAEQLKEFHSNVKQKLYLILGKSISPQNIIVEQNETNIKVRISDILEDLVSDRLNAIKEDLQRFIRRDQTAGIHYDELIKDKQLAGAIKSFFDDRMSILDMHNEAKDEKPLTELLISKLTTKVKFTVIPLLGQRLFIPDRICNDLLHESKFEAKLCEALKTDTVRRLKEIYEKYLAQAEEHTFSSTFSDEFVDILKEDWKEVFRTTERIFGSMARVISVMKKMIFEIDGYLKQSKKYKHLSLPDVSHQLTDDLRKELLSIEGVYGLGHVYGQLEIHVNVKESELHAVKKLVDELLHKNNFQESYSVKRIEANI